MTDLLATTTAAVPAQQRPAADPPATRQLYDIGAEQATLGAMMLSSDVVAEVATLTDRAFYRPAHGIIYRAISRLAAEGQPHDPVAVVTALVDSGDIGRAGGIAYVHELVRAVPTAANGPYYARRVAELDRLRELDARTRRIQRAIHTGGMPAAEVVDLAQQTIADLDLVGEDEPQSWASISPAVLTQLEENTNRDGETPGVPTGLHDLDSVLSGLRPGQLIVVAARPGVGKSVALAGFAQHASWRCGLPTVVFSLEMTRTELGARMLSAYTGVSLQAMHSGELTDEEWTRLARAAGESEQAPLWIDDTPDLTLAEIRSRARRIHRRNGGLALVAVDYLQLIHAPNTETRQVAVSTISRGLKMLAKELSAPVVVAAQLNRSPEQRTNKRPQLSDLRESGSIEQDADVVILLHREDYYDQESPRAGEVDFIVAKHRGGPTDTVTAAAQLHYGRFVSMAVEP